MIVLAILLVPLSIAALFSLMAWTERTLDRKPTVSAVADRFAGVDSGAIIDPVAKP